MANNSHSQLNTGKQPKRSRALLDLASAYGVMSSYRGLGGVRHVSTDTLVSILRSLGAELEGPENASRALRERRRVLWDRKIEPVTIVWEGSTPEVLLRLSKDFRDPALHAVLTLDTGETRDFDSDTNNLPVQQATEVNGQYYVIRTFPLPGILPTGYHRFSVELEDRIEETLIICAPMKAYADGFKGKIWGAFLPLYAMHSRRSWGAGDFSDLESLYDWIAELGGQVVGTLPLFASYLEKPFEPSPYSPASRLFWNELYIDLAAVPELRNCEPARRMMQSIEQGELSELRPAPLVDYRRQMALKRKVLEELSGYFFGARADERRESFERFLKTHPVVEDYACFRAAGELRKESWIEWPLPLRNGTIRPADYEERAKQYHLYVQWIAEEQITALAAKFRKNGPGLYFDLPLGINSNSYDLWRNRRIFVEHVSEGAPPDAVFIGGQNWGFPPLHPERTREDRYEYVINYLSRNMQFAGILRVDHVMGLHRLYWVPDGGKAGEGTYVNYPAEELYAILCLESHKNKCMLLGENLGTVPMEVNKSMGRHGIQKMYVVEYELESKLPEVLRTPPADAVASLNTHDMPQFAAYLGGMDIQGRLELGLFDQVGAERERENRTRLVRLLEKFLQDQGLLSEPASKQEILRACLEFLARGRSRVLLINMEDLWLETLPQNVPTSGDQWPNWQRKARHSLEEIRSMSSLVDMLREIDQLRKKGSLTPEKQRAAA